MGFWKNVETECEYRGISRKELASAAAFSVNTISNGIKRNGTPPADLALRISKALNIPLEKLMDEEKTLPINCDIVKSDTKLFERYKPLIKKMESLSPDSKAAIITLIDQISSFK